MTRKGSPSEGIWPSVTVPAAPPPTLTPLWLMECPSPLLRDFQMVQEGSSAVATHDRRWMVGPSYDEQSGLPVPSWAWVTS